MVTFAQVWSVKSSRPIREVFARIAVCAAVLATSLFGRSLHDLQHQILDASVAGTSTAETERTSRPSCHCAFHSHCEPTDGRSDHNDSKPSHDSDSCAICYVFGLSATSTPMVDVPQADEPHTDFVVVQSESACSEFRSCCKARGPPAV